MLPLSAVWVQHHDWSKLPSSVTHLLQHWQMVLPADKDLLADCKNLGHYGSAACRGCHTTAGLLDAAAKGPATPYPKTRGAEKSMADIERGTTQRWQKQLALKWHMLRSSEGHNSTSTSTNTAIPGKALLALLAGHTPSLGSKDGERHFSCFSFGCVFYFPCLGALRVVVGCSRWWVLFF